MGSKPEYLIYHEAHLCRHLVEAARAHGARAMYSPESDEVFVEKAGGLAYRISGEVVVYVLSYLDPLAAFALLDRFPVGTDGRLTGAKNYLDAEILRAREDLYPSNYPQHLRDQEV